MFGWKKKKEEKEQKEESSKENDKLESGFHPTYNVELLYDEMPCFQIDSLLKALQENCGDVELLTETKNQDLIAFVFKDYTVEYKDNVKVPAQCVIAKVHRPFDARAFEISIQQSWEWKEAREVVSTCKYSLLISEMMAAGLEYKTKLGLFQKALTAIIKEAPCKAIHWVYSQQIVNPTAYIESQMENSDRGYLYGALNVRFFNVSNGAESEMLMDTVGLAALGIPDLQCHFIDLNPKEVARVLYNCGYYLFENGDVIEDGHTVEGAKPGHKWKCQHEVSLVEPKRIVLDLNPGYGHAAGDREETFK